MERRRTRLCVRVVPLNTHQRADPLHPLGRLRADGVRPRDRYAAEKRNEIPSSHAIKS
jgi:hypothetical protein